jgi:hypothetical protein
MDRKEFLKGAATGLCACVAACMPAVAAEAPKPEDWRFAFVKKRFAKLLTALGENVDGPALTASLQQMGDFCASEGDGNTRKFVGDVDGFCAELIKNGQKVERDDARQIYTMTYDPKGDCFCPFNSVAVKTPGMMCECSAAWARHNWTMVLQRNVKVAIKETVLRGGKVCKFEITAA